jgi:hypothetical protein
MDSRHAEDASLGTDAAFLRMMGRHAYIAQEKAANLVADRPYAPPARKLATAHLHLTTTRPSLGHMSRKSPVLVTSVSCVTGGKGDALQLNHAIDTSNTKRSSARKLWTGTVVAKYVPAFELIRDPEMELPDEMIRRADYITTATYIRSLDSLPDSTENDAGDDEDPFNELNADVRMANQSSIATSHLAMAATRVKGSTNTEEDNSLNADITDLMTRTSLAPSTRDQLLDEDIPVAFTVAHAACTGTRAIFLATPVVQSTVRVPRSHEEAMKLPERKE